LKLVDERKARGWLRTHSKMFDDAVQLADGCADAFNLYEPDLKVPTRLLELAKEAMKG
jgi:hypothetical protein